MVNEREFGVSLLEANISDSEEEDGSNTLQARLDDIPPSVGEWGFTTPPGPPLPAAQWRLDVCRGNPSPTLLLVQAQVFTSILTQDQLRRGRHESRCDWAFWLFYFTNSRAHFLAHDLIIHCYALWSCKNSAILVLFPCRPPDESAGVCVCSHLLDHCAAEGSSQKRLLLHSRPVQTGIPAGVWHRLEWTLNTEQLFFHQHSTVQHEAADSFLIDK